MSKTAKTRSGISAGGTTTLNQGPTILNQGRAKQQANQQRPTGQSQGQTLLSVDVWQLAGQAGNMHSMLLPEIRRLRNLSTADLIQDTNKNLKTLLERKALTTKEFDQLRGIFDAAVSEAAEQIEKLHNAITSAEQKASPLALAIAGIAFMNVRNAGQKGFSWRATVKDLSGAVLGAGGGIALGPAGIVGCAIAGAVGASL